MVRSGHQEGSKSPFRSGRSKRSRKAKKRIATKTPRSAIEKRLAEAARASFAVWPLSVNFASALARRR